MMSVDKRMRPVDSRETEKNVESRWAGKVTLTGKKVALLPFARTCTRLCTT